MINKKLKEIKKTRLRKSERVRHSQMVIDNHIKTIEDVNEALRLAFELINKVDKTSTIRMTHHNIDKNSRLSLQYIVLETEALENLITNDLTKIIIMELALNGDATRTGLIKGIETNYELIINRTTIYEHLTKLETHGWIDHYQIITGQRGFPHVFFRYAGTGTELRIWNRPKSAFAKQTGGII